MKPKVCLIIPSLQAGGMERVMAELANHFGRQSHWEVHLVLYGLSRDIFYPLSPEIVVHKPAFPFNNGQRLLSTLKTILYLRRRLKALRPESCLSFGEYWNNFVLLASFGTGIPVYVSDRSQPNKSLGRLHEALRKFLYPRTKGVIAQTEKARQIYQKLYRQPNMRVIGNPIRAILKSEYSEQERENTVLMVGRLIASKHQDRLIKIFLQINKPGWKLVLVGYDHLKQQHSQRLQALIEDHQAAERVILAGKRHDVERFYLGSKIFAFTSSSEGFPNVVGEALSAGLPVVSYDCDAGPSDLIDHGVNGYLVDLYDDDQFAQYLSQLMDDQALREKMAKAALASMQKFQVDSIAGQFFNFITERGQ